MNPKDLYMPGNFATLYRVHDCIKAQPSSERIEESSSAITIDNDRFSFRNNYLRT